MPTLTASVGHPGGTNKNHDVSLIQAMLRVIKNPKGKTYVAFRYDGGCGLNRGTHKAIQAFQTDYKIAVGKGTEKLGKVDNDSKTFKEMVKKLPATHKGLMALEGQVFVYLESDASAAKSSEARVTGHAKFQSDFKTKVAALIREMYKKYKIVLCVIPDKSHGGFRTFADQRALMDVLIDGKHVTNAGPGESNHNYGNGADIGFQDLTWIERNSSARTKKDAYWLNALAKAHSQIANELWKLRNKLTTLHSSGKSGDLVHLQSYSDKNVSMVKSLANLLNERGNMWWEYSGGEYRCNYGLGDKDNRFNIGRGKSTAKNIWDEKCDVSQTNLAVAVNQALKRRAAGTLESYEETILKDFVKLTPDGPKSIKTADIKGDHYNKMRKWLKGDLERAEQYYAEWTPIS